MNRSALAREMQVSLPTIDAWTRRGCPFSKKGRSIIFDLDKVKAWLLRNQDDYRQKAGKEDMGSPMNALVNMGCLHFALWLAKKLKKDKNLMKELFFEWIQEKDLYVIEQEKHFDTIITGN